MTDKLYRAMPVWDLIDGLLDNRPTVYEKCKAEILRRMSAADGEHISELVEREEAMRHGPAPKKMRRN
jgi:hypothetical protein